MIDHVRLFCLFYCVVLNLILVGRNIHVDSIFFFC